MIKDKRKKKMNLFYKLSVRPFSVVSFLVLVFRDFRKIVKSSPFSFTPYFASIVPVYFIFPFVVVLLCLCCICLFFILFLINI